MQKYIIRDGFVFSRVTHPGNIYDAIVIKHPQNTPCSCPKIVSSQKSLQEHIDFINKYKIEKALIIAENIDFITKCPCLKYLRIIPSDNAPNRFDYSPLYSLPNIKSLSCATIYGTHFQHTTSIDYSMITGLESISISGQGHFNYNTLDTLKSLGISGSKKETPTDMFSSVYLDSLMVIQGAQKSLEGVQKAQNLKCLYLYHNSRLRDISQLIAVRESLTALKIDCCNKIEDFSILEKLENLELLELYGNNALPSLNFINSMKNLKTFVFNMNILDGNLDPCKSLSYAKCLNSKKHYNLKDSDLPKGEFVNGNTAVDLWRRYW